MLRVTPSNIESENSHIESEIVAPRHTESENRHTPFSPFDNMEELLEMK